jgi:hypothetical protein
MPGQMVLTLIPRGPKSRAIGRAIPTTPACVGDVTEGGRRGREVEAELLAYGLGCRAIPTTSPYG